VSVFGHQSGYSRGGVSDNDAGVVARQFELVDAPANLAGEEISGNALAFAPKPFLPNRLFGLSCARTVLSVGPMCAICGKGWTIMLAGDAKY